MFSSVAAIRPARITGAAAYGNSFPAIWPATMNGTSATAATTAAVNAGPAAPAAAAATSPGVSGPPSARWARRIATVTRNAWWIATASTPSSPARAASESWVPSRNMVSRPTATGTGSAASTSSASRQLPVAAWASSRMPITVAIT